MVLSSVLPVVGVAEVLERKLDEDRPLLLVVPVLVSALFLLVIVTRLALAILTAQRRADELARQTAALARRCPNRRSCSASSPTGRCTTRSPGWPTGPCSPTRSRVCSTIPAGPAGTRCCCSTSTSSRTSTTPSATRSATSCWSRSARRLRALPGRRPSWSGSAATSSRSSSSGHRRRAHPGRAAARPSAPGLPHRRPGAVRHHERRRAHDPAPPAVRMTPADVLRDADLALYAAKAAARTGSAVPPRAAAARLDHARTSAGLRHALTNDQFVLHYQPIVDVCSGAIVAVEALAAVAHRERSAAAAVGVHPGRRGHRPDRAHRCLGAAPVVRDDAGGSPSTASR